MDVTLHGTSGDCQVRVGPWEWLARAPTPRPTLLVTDETVRRLHGARFPDGVPVLTIGQGEESKTLETVAALYRGFLDAGLDRGGSVLGVGGGIVCDVASYAAATWMRGVDVGLVPTTVLAQADAGVGGKNGVNFGGTKNLVGTIRQPRFVHCAPEFLATLSRAEVQNGLAEVVKSAAIADAELFSFLEANVEALLAAEPATLTRAIEASLRVKVAVVEKDELEQGDRKRLNFGHTLGHALELARGLRHGEAVAVGMVFAARLSVERGLLPAGAVDRLVRLLEQLGLPTSFAPAPALFEGLTRDKKRAGKSVHMALLTAVGESVIQPVPLSDLEAALAR